MPKNYEKAPALRRGFVSLPQAVEAEFGRACPCCLRPMARKPVRKFHAPPSNQVTRAHDFAVGRGGDPHQWFFMCVTCNNDQGHLDLVTWVRKLGYDGDPRAELVSRLATFVRAWVAAVKKEEAA
jgi:hypothetical protein